MSKYSADLDILHSSYVRWNSKSIFADVQCPGDGKCSNRGTCDISTGICVCDSGFEGDMCQGKKN